ncbi:ATPase [Candidatus Woesearchaeota archaeon CG_4_10_14_0_2_um_filter_33_13]|nr:MAG: ATPase [Candidatus Woesearchaeota archaeon CG_4_10_14_0_2_um_filter_33_13]
MFFDNLLLRIFIDEKKHILQIRKAFNQVHQLMLVMKIEKYFDDQTMSVHLREDAFPLAKKGVPGKWEIKLIDDKRLSLIEIKEIAQDIINQTEQSEKNFLEIERFGSSVLQIGVYRIVITRRPFSDGWEITAVKPVVRLNLEDYHLDDKLRKKLTEESAGVLIAGSPGEGKTTIGRALAEYFAENGKIVKTVESPRDMLLSSKITQYSLNHGDKDEIRDVLLLSRPDNTFFDEMRKTEDFQLFADLRLAGIGMIGIVHATNPIDAIQRFIGRIEMGIIPQVIDTVVFVQSGQINKVLELKMIVKVPTGMTEADLSRPLIEVRDFSSGALEYEIYSYGEHTVVIPLLKKERKEIWTLAADKIKEYFNRYSTENIIEFISDNRIKVYVPTSVKSTIIGQNGSEISKIEKELKLKVDVLDLSNTKRLGNGQDVEYSLQFSKENIVFNFDQSWQDKEVAIMDGNDLLIRTKIGKNSAVKVSIGSVVGKSIVQSIKSGKIKIKSV